MSLELLLALRILSNNNTVRSMLIGQVTHNIVYNILICGHCVWTSESELLVEAGFLFVSMIIDCIDYGYVLYTIYGIDLYVYTCTW